MEQIKKNTHVRSKTEKLDSDTSLSPSVSPFPPKTHTGEPLRYRGTLWSTLNGLWCWKFRVEEPQEKAPCNEA